MSFNPAKCEALRVSRKSNIIPFTYTIHNQPLELVNSAKYLGVTFSSKLEWKPHISNITKKANSTVGFLRRNLRSCPRKVKKQAYVSFVRPTLEYASSAWSPHWAEDIASLEAVQRRAARFIMSDFSYYSSPTAMLATLSLPTLEQRRAFTKSVMMYKIVNGLVAISPSPYLTPNLRRNTYAFVYPHSRVDAHLHSFFPSAVRVWNNLGPTVQAPSLDAFKLEAGKVLLPY